MTVVNAWWERDPRSDHEARWALVQCDGCVAGRWPIGTPEVFRAKGWRFDEFESGPHLCPSCANGGRVRGEVPRRDPLVGPALPNLLVIGAAKCGTTSLHRYLAMHPEVGMSARKELNFFINPKCLDGLEVYASYFDAQALVRGESSPIYTYHPITQGVPERIRAAVPEMRLIYLVRDPIQRFISHYVQRRARGKEPLDLESAVGELENPFNQYMVASRFATQLEQYLKVFPSEQLLIVDQADLRQDRDATLRKVFRFLEVDDRFTTPAFATRHNLAENKRRNTRVGAFLRKSRLADAVRSLPPIQRDALFTPARQALSRRVTPSELGAEAQQRLRETFRGEVERLREMTGQKFGSWDV